MEKKIISIPTNESKIYKQILFFLNSILELTSQERDVLAEIIQLDNEYEILPEEKRGKFILSSEMREEILTRINVKNARHLSVIIHKLKKKTFLNNQIVLSENNIVHPYLKFKPDSDGFKIEVSFVKTIVDEKKVVTPTPISTSVDISTDEQLTTVEELSDPIIPGKDNVIEEVNFNIELVAPEE